MRATVLLIATAALAACEAGSSADSPAGAQVTDSAGIRVVSLPSDAPPDTVELERLWEHGAGPADYPFEYVMLGTLRDDGVAVVADAGATQVVAIDAAAGEHRILARQGQGPDEVASPRQIRGGPGNEVWVEDVLNGKLLRFEGDSLVSAVNASANPLAPSGLMPVGVAPGGRLLAVTGRYRSDFEEPWMHGTLAVFDPAALSVDTVGSFPMAPRAVEGPRSPYIASGTAAATGSSFVTARMDIPALTWTRPDGTVAQIVRWQSTPRYPNQQDWDAFVQGYAADLERVNPQRRGKALEQLIEDRLARYELDESAPLPLFGSLYGADDGSVWVAPFPTSRTPPDTYAVMSSDGQWRATVRFDRPFGVMHVTEDAVLGVQIGEFDVQTVAVYALPFGPGE